MQIGRRAIVSNIPSNLKNPRGERRCHVGNDANGNVFEPFVRAAWADAEIERLRDLLRRSWFNNAESEPVLQAEVMSYFEGGSVHETQTRLPGWKSVDAFKLARQFHEVYERLAPSFGYETRKETRAFDPHSPNGRLMIAVCRELIEPPAVETGPKPDAEKAPVTSDEMCPTWDQVQHKEHNGKCVYCGAPMKSQSKASGDLEVRKLYNETVDELNREQCASIGHEFRPIDSSGQIACMFCNEKKV